MMCSVCYVFFFFLLLSGSSTLSSIPFFPFIFPFSFGYDKKKQEEQVLVDPVKEL